MSGILCRMKRLALLVILLAAACKPETAATDTTPVDTREPVAIRYVGAPELAVRAQPNDTAPILITYQNGESISILADKGEWVEVRSGDGSGWARAADLTSAEGRQQAEDNPEPKFRVMPMPVSAPSAKGEIYLEADVNSDGDVISIRTISNTTGSPALEHQNTEALKHAKFFPIMQNNQRTKFKYYHRVTY
jgi:TonB family protein